MPGVEHQIVILLLRQALERIVAYQTPDELRQKSENDYGLEYEEALEMAYENIQEEAKRALFAIDQFKAVL